MSILNRDPTYMINKEQIFMDIAKGLEKASNHPIAPGGCVIVRQRDILASGRSVMCSGYTEIDCIECAIATAAKNGTPVVGSTVYTTCYPLPESIIQCHIVGINLIYFLFRDQPTGYAKRRETAVKIAHELGITVDVYDDSNTTKSNEQEKHSQALQTGKIRRSDIDLSEYTTHDY